MSARRPPGFMNAMSTCRVPSSLSDHRCTSATRLPSVDSPPRFSGNDEAPTGFGEDGPAQRRRGGAELDVAEHVGDRRPRPRRWARPPGHPGRAVPAPFIRLKISFFIVKVLVDPVVLDVHPREPLAVLAARDHRATVDHVVVGEVRVPRDDRVDVLVRAEHDLAEARVGIDRRLHVGGRRALVDEQDDDVGLAVLLRCRRSAGRRRGSPPRSGRRPSMSAMPAGLTSEGSSSVTAPTKPMVTPSNVFV